LNAVRNGSSRNVSIENLQNLDKNFIESLFVDFGPIDKIEIISEMNQVYVHLTCITEAIKAVLTLSMDPSLSNCRIGYGKDRCSPLSSSSMLQGFSDSIVDQRFSGLVTAPLMGNRTVYLGGIHPEVTTKDLCDVILFFNWRRLLEVEFFKISSIWLIKILHSSHLLKLPQRLLFIIEA
jgi:hypothetical protein